MAETYSLRPLVALLVPLSPLVLNLFIPQDMKRLRKFTYLMGSLVSFVVVLSLLPGTLSGRTLTVQLFPIVEGISLRLTLDALGYYYGLTISFLWILATFYSIGYIEHREDRFFSFMALTNFSLLGCAFSQNMFTYFVFYEIMTLAAYPLIIHEETESARRAGLKYLTYAIPAGAVIFFAIAGHYFWGGGNLSLIEAGTLNLSQSSHAVLTVLFLAYLAGFGVKAAIMPLHGWVPDAHPEAPSPASALLSGVILKAGAFGIIRVVLNVFGLSLFKELRLDTYLIIISGITIVVASMFALTQDNLKRRLAYSSIGQVSYILLGLSMGTYSGVLGSLMHLAHHALMKGCLFLAAGVILVKTGKRNVSEMAGIGRRLPVTMTAFSVAALAMMGTPPSVGFLSKWLLGSGTIEAGEPAWIAVLLLSALLNAAYFLPIIYTAFFKEPEGTSSDESAHGSGESLPLVIPLVILTVLIVLGGLVTQLPGFPYSLLNETVSRLTH
ncbi:MAG: proton-conducting transporter membrane subunit [Chloroflexota bacterium]